MRFGLIVSKQHPPGVSMVERFREHIAQVRAALGVRFTRPSWRERQDLG